MDIKEAKNIIDKASKTINPLLDRAVYKLLNVQFNILTSNYQKDIEKLQSQYDALRDMRNDFLDAANWEELQEKIKKWNL